MAKPESPTRDPIAYFAALGDAIDRRWREQELAPDGFTAIAEAALVASPPSANVDPDAVLDLLISRHPVPPQWDLAARFSDLPVTLFRNERFVIDALFWLDDLPSIHEHRFSGAFHVLSGSSIQTLYDFAPDRSFHHGLACGKLTLRGVELLQKGATRPIERGGRTIHGLFHLERPSISIVVRTYTDESDLQLNYEPPGLACAPAPEDEATIRQLQALALLHRMESPAYLASMRCALAAADALGAYHLLAQAFERDRSDPAALEALVVCASGSAHAAIVDVVSAALRERIRTIAILETRNAVRDRDLRYFLAVMLCSPHRRAAIELVRAYAPDHAPADVVVRWFGALAGALRGNPGHVSALPRHVDERTLVALHALVESDSVEDAQRALAEYYDENASELADGLSVEALLRPFTLLQPLLVRENESRRRA